MIWCCLFPVIHNDAASAIVGVLWIGAWVIMSPLKKWLVIHKVDPKLDRKYPLTASRLNKNEPE